MDEDEFKMIGLDSLVDCGQLRKACERGKIERRILKWA